MCEITLEYMLWKDQVLPLQLQLFKRHDAYNNDRYFPSLHLKQNLGCVAWQVL